ncbi:FliH/SctL family protein [Glaciibacter superstes]|uniref:FliH/SctL family protein n=1 Tax=Glaciibacter superstes TaxID=501023 RepID=UPI0003B360AA|nr:FliH/SctL family protein [Glaciibacter superstes]
MSTEAAFLATPFPRLGDDETRRIERVARAQGHAAGYTEGLRAAQAEIDARRAELEADHAARQVRAQRQTDSALALLGRAAEALNSRTLPILEELRRELAAAAVELAEAVLGYELADHETAAHAALDRVCAAGDPRLVHTVRMHPDDVSLLAANVGATTGIELSADPSLARGDAVMEFPDGYLDARLASALARAKAALLGANQ